MIRLEIAGVLFLLLASLTQTFQFENRAYFQVPFVNIPIPIPATDI